MNKNSFLLNFAGALSFGAAIFQAVIALVPEWSAAFGACDALISNSCISMGILDSNLLLRTS